MELREILGQLVDRGASDVFIIAGRPLGYKINGQICDWSADVLKPEDTKTLILATYSLTDGREPDRLLQHGDDDFSFAIRGVSRFRVNTYKQRGSLAAVIRVVQFTLPDPAALHIPEEVLSLADQPKGMMLLTGPSGSGKSTTLACMIDRINASRNGHIITLEDPIEYMHSHKKCIVSQRELEIDTDSYAVALRAALRQSPNIILIGELRDAETIRIAMTAAETGHLVISTLHTVGTANTVDRIVDTFPAEHQPQIRLQLAMVLQAVVSQQLIPAVGGGIMPAFEIMRCNTAIRNMIRESKTHQIDSVIFSSASEGMVTMDASLLALYKAGKISEQEARLYCLSPDAMQKKMAL